MTGNQTMDYYVRPRHLYSHSRTCTRSGLCRRPSRLVASLICYLLDRASVHEISALVTCSSICQTFPATMEILIYSISSTIMEIMVLCISSSWRFWSMYIVRGDDHICSIMFHAYSWPLYSYVSGTARCICRLYAELYYGIMLIGWLVFHLGTFITSFLGWTYNVFRPSYNPSDLIH
jgi:hypothetical protein